MFKTKSLLPDAKLKFPDYLGYFLGAGTNITGYIVSAFLLVYYSNVLYLGLAQVSMIMAVSKIFDGLSDLLMGRIIDRTKSRFGKARPWYARMIIPTAISVLLLFWMPAGLSENWKYIYIFVTYNLVSTVCFTANAVAHSSMIGFMTLNTKSRGIVGVMSMVSNTVFTVLVTNFFLKLCKAFGNGNAYTQKSFTMTIMVYLAIYALCAFLAFFLTRERIHNIGIDFSNELDIQQNIGEKAEEKMKDVPFKIALQSLLTNKYWILCIIMCLGFYFLFSYASSVTIYFAQYIMNNIDMQGTLSTLLYVVIIVGILCALPVMIRLGKRFTMVVGFAISAFGWFMPQISLV